MGKERDLKKRTMNFALAVSDLCEVFPNRMKGRHVAGQLFRAGSALAANYRAACRAKSRPDFIAKLGTVIEEADECDFWLEFAVAAKLLRARFSIQHSAFSIQHSALPIGRFSSPPSQ